MSPLPATRRSFLPWASWSPPRSRAIRTIPAMPVPVSPLRSSRSSALEDPCPSHRGKPWRRGPMGSLRWSTRSPAAEAGGERRRQEGAEAESRRYAFSAERWNPLPRPDRAAAEAVVEGLGGATGVCPESTVVKSGSAMPPVGVHHPEVESFPRRAPRGSSPTFMGFFNVKERSEERLLGWPRAKARDYPYRVSRESTIPRGSSPRGQLSGVGRVFRVAGAACTFEGTALLEQAIG
jgi:hypothetical protein